MFEDDILAFYRGKLRNFPPGFKLRLFLSLDFSNSTNYKQSIPPPPPSESSDIEVNLSNEGRDDLTDIFSATSPWIAPFSYFISRIDRVIDNAWGRVIQSVVESLDENEKINTVSAKTLLRPKYWKPIGDEVVYQVQIVHPLQIALCLCCWKVVTKEVRKQIITSRPLNVKSAAWLAGFPINNSEFVVGVTSEDWKFLYQAKDTRISKYNAAMIHHIFPVLYRLDRKFFEEFIEGRLKLNPKKLTKNNIEDYKNFARRLEYKKIDFLGPQMDTGFRIADKSTPKKMMISADIAYILSVLLEGDVIYSPEKINSANKKPKDQNSIDIKTRRFCQRVYLLLKRNLKDRRDLENIGKNYNSTNIESIPKKGVREIITENLKIYYDGRVPLKGVREGRPYPLFWLNADDENIIDIKEAQFSGDSNVEYHKIRDFTFRFLAQNYLGYDEEYLNMKESLPKSNSFVGDEWLMVPFIENFELLPYYCESEKQKKKDLRSIISSMQKTHRNRKEKIQEFLAKFHFLSVVSSTLSVTTAHVLTQGPDNNDPVNLGIRDDAKRWE